MNCQKMVRLLRGEVGLKSRSKLSDNEVIEDLNEAVEFCDELSDGRLIESLVTWPMVANKDIYALPGTFLDVKQVMYCNNPPMDKYGWDDLKYNAKNSFSSGCFAFAIFGNQIRIVGRESSAAVSSDLYASLSKVETDYLYLNYDADNEFPIKGTVKIDNEKIKYHYMSRTGNIVTLQFLERGQEHTAAAAHSTSATVTLQDIEMLYFAKDLGFILAPDYDTGKIVLSSGGSVDAGTHVYYWCYYDPDTNRESLPRNFGVITIESGTQNVAFSELIDDPDGEGYQKRIYRSAAGTTAPLYLVTTLDNGTTTFTDSVADSSIASNASYDKDNCSLEYDQMFHRSIGKVGAGIRLRKLKRFEESDKLIADGSNLFMTAANLYKGAREGDYDMVGEF